MKNKNSNIVLPFNIDNNLYIRMFEGIKKTPLSMAIMPMAVEGLDPIILKEVIEKAKKITLQINSVHEDIERMCKFVPSGYCFLDIQVNDDSVFTLSSTNAKHEPYPTLLAAKLLQNWCFKGVYYQVGFYMSPCQPDGSKCSFLASSMLGYDMMVIESGSLEPVYHNPAAIVIDKEVYDNISSEYFLKGGGRWDRSLILLRNHWMVTLRALLMDRDPFTEWDRFQKAGGKYFLDYPTLCP